MSGEVNIAYQSVGNGPIDVVLVPGFVSHLDLMWENPNVVRSLERLASFSRLILFDKRGTGLSDRVGDLPTLEQRIDDVRAVMEALGSEQAALIGLSEGGPMSILFAATHPELVSALVLYGSMAKAVATNDYPWGVQPEALSPAATELFMSAWGSGAMADVFAPSIADEPGVKEWFGKFERQSASPGALLTLMKMFSEIDVRPILPTVGVPTLVIHKTGDRAVNVRSGRWLAEQIAGSKYVELPGIDHSPWVGDTDAFIGEIEEFLTGVRGESEYDRVLATIMFTDIVDSTKLAAGMGDTRWRELLENHQARVRALLDRFRGREVKSLGDGFLASFDGPARAVRCGQAISNDIAALGIQIRVGLHTGEAEVMGDDLGGIAVHIAARVGAIAQPGEVLVSSTVKDLVAGSGLGFSDRGVHPLKGVPGEWRLYSVD